MYSMYKNIFTKQQDEAMVFTLVNYDSFVLYLHLQQFSEFP